MGTRGGKRAGAGRPSTGSKLFMFRAPREMAEVIQAQPNKTEFIRSCITRSISQEQAGLQALGRVIPASQVRELELPFFDFGIVAGFPIPLDNDERAQDIEILRMLCPHPESCYLIRVQGNSMIDADIFDGDLIIVDKSNRNPSSHEVAVCEYNGDYTIKYVRQQKGRLTMVPANPDYPEIPVEEGDRFVIWGVVTFVIHSLTSRRKCTP